MGAIENRLRQVLKRPFETPLTPEQQRGFPQWKRTMAPTDSGEDYDFPGAYKAGVQPDPMTGHWPDTYKKPNHPTFSEESIYSSLTGTKPGRWTGPQHDVYTPFGQRVQPRDPWEVYRSNADQVPAQLMMLGGLIEQLKRQGGTY